MTSKQKNKGNKLERELRDHLNSIFNTEEFARTPNSGAIMGKSNYQKNQGLEDQTKVTLGSDIICPEWFRFCVECKHYKDVPNYSTLIKKDEKNIDKWLAEVSFDARNLNLTPMLVFKTDRKGKHFAIPRVGFEQLLTYNCSHVVFYRRFAIIGEEQFIQIADAINANNNDEQTFTQINQWLNSDPYIDDLIDSF